MSNSLLEKLKELADKEDYLESELARIREQRRELINRFNLNKGSDDE